MMHLDPRVKPPLFPILNRGHPLARGLVGCWLLNEGSGSRVNDYSGNSNSGTIVNAVWSGGKFGNGLSFNGNGDYVQVADSSSLDNISTVGTITVVAWFCPMNLSYGNTYQRIISKLYNCFDLLIFESDKKLRWDVSGSTLASTIVLTENVWYHTATTYDLAGGTNNSKLYMNGRLDVQGTKASGLTPNNNGLFFGCYDGTVRYFPGFIDHVLIYSRVLSASEILQLYLEPFCMFLEHV